MAFFRKWLLASLAGAISLPLRGGLSHLMLFKGAGFGDVCKERIDELAKAA